MKIPSFEEYINEQKQTEISIEQFPNPLRDTLKKNFHKLGLKDGDKFDDIVRTVPVNISVKNLKPSQDAIYLAKVISMAVGGVSGGDLGAVISKDNYILDGHHRWAASILNNPTVKIKGYQADLNIDDLIPVLRAVGDAFGNERRGQPKGDLNIFQSDINDFMEALNGKGMNMKFYSVEKGLEWFEANKEQILKNFQLIKATTPPLNAPERKDMPVIDADKGEVKKTAKILNKGAVDVRSPYVKK